MGYRERSWWGWGHADEALDDAACRRLAERALRPWMPIDGSVIPLPFDPLLGPPRLIPPSIMEETFLADSMSRASHAYGKAFRDVVRALHGELPNPPDLVCMPRTVHDIVAALDWAEAAGAAVVPYGGGTSVVGGVEYRGDRPWVSLDMSRLNRIAEIDDVNRAVRVQAGVFGPALEEALRPHDLTLRHLPQSFEFSTVGGWLATRSGGHYATGPTRIDAFVEALRVITPQGPVESPRVPSSGAGPDPNALFLGSEGALGVIVEAWLRVQKRPSERASAAMSFPVYLEAVAAAKNIVQAGLRPANCRLLDPVEAMLNAGAQDGQARLMLGFEGADASLLLGAVEICRAHGGTDAEKGESRGFREAFLKAPYTRDALVRLGLVVETVETACTWSRFEALHAAVLAAAQAAAPTGVAVVTCRFTHVYPDGPAPYFTIITPGRRGAEVAIWDEIKAAVSDAIADNGGTITHHHAVGRDHRPWYDNERSPLYQDALRAAKRTLDPRGILNPGVLV
ncbi:FAD-binding oxidoreductase [Dactylosporangium darangshiense]|uniref:FAD-binding oxidoreductase n=1 Tax=Dactylosporangium darangshiense TaxID=579108 RepID=A0ABP8DG49_9ACTN